MKRLFLRSSLALACALSLASCGGGDGNLQLGGQIVGLTKSDLVLQNNGASDEPIPAGATGFVFDKLLESDESYNVTVKQPGPVGAVCTVENGKGKMGQFNVMSVVVTCKNELRILGGTINGLTSDGLILVNGSDQQPIPVPAVTVPPTPARFEMAPVQDGSPYGITVLKQPASQTCAVVNGTGTMGATPPANVAVNCS